MISRNTIFLVGAFPPPVHGMALVNTSVKNHIIKFGVEPAIFDISASTLNRALYVRISRAPKVFLYFIRFFFSIFNNKKSTLYLSVSGGYGQLYEVLFLIVARLTKCKIYLHHHSFSYLVKPKKITRILVEIAGKSSTHITLCDDMAKRLGKQYKFAKNIIVLSNVVFVGTNIKVSRPKRQSLKKIGFISNISADKGIFEFLALFKFFIDKFPNANIKGIIAGQFEDKIIERKIRMLLANLPNVTYIGSIYGIKKENFFKAIDVLIFPTKYVNEAEPLTIYEAMANGVPTIARQKGCINNIIIEGSGLVINGNEDFVQVCANQLIKWHSSGKAFQETSNNAYNRYISLMNSYNKKLKPLIHQIVFGP